MQNLGGLSEAALLAMPEEDYMSAPQLAYFKALLQSQQQEISDHLAEVKAAITVTKEPGDFTDFASVEEERNLLLRQADRETRLLHKIEEALLRIEAGDYGYCEDTGKPIGLQRLLLRPTATLSLEAKEAQEAQERLLGKKH